MAFTSVMNCSFRLRGDRLSSWLDSCATLVCALVTASSISVLGDLADASCTWRRRARASLSSATAAARDASAAGLTPPTSSPFSLYLGDNATSSSSSLSASACLAATAFSSTSGFGCLAAFSCSSMSFSVNVLVTLPFSSRVSNFKTSVGCGTAASASKSGMVSSTGVSLTRRRFRLRRKSDSIASRLACSFSICSSALSAAS